SARGSSANRQFMRDIFRLLSQLTSNAVYRVLATSATPPQGSHQTIRHSVLTALPYPVDFHGIEELKSWSALVRHHRHQTRNTGASGVAPAGPGSRMLPSWPVSRQLPCPGC